MPSPLDQLFRCLTMDVASFNQYMHGNGSKREPDCCLAKLLFSLITKRNIAEIKKGRKNRPFSLHPIFMN